MQLCQPQWRLPGRASASDLSADCEFSWRGIEQKLNRWFRSQFSSSAFMQIEFIGKLRHCVRHNNSISNKFLLPPRHDLEVLCQLNFLQIRFSFLRLRKFDENFSHKVHRRALIQFASFVASWKDLQIGSHPNGKFPVRIEGLMAVSERKKIIDFRENRISRNLRDFTMLEIGNFRLQIGRKILHKTFPSGKVDEFHRRKHGKIVRGKLKMALTRKIFTDDELRGKSFSSTSNWGETIRKSFESNFRTNFKTFRNKFQHF